MSIVATEVESIHGGTNERRLVYYRCQDDQGAWHRYGPVITSNPVFDADAYKPTVAAKVADQLTEQEAARLLEP